MPTEASNSELAYRRDFYVAEIIIVSPYISLKKVLIYLQKWTCQPAVGHGFKQVRSEARTIYRYFQLCSLEYSALASLI